MSAPVVLNAQHDPQNIWFFTSVTAPAFTQSTLSAAVTSAWLNLLPEPALHGQSRTAQLVKFTGTISVCTMPHHIIA